MNKKSERIFFILFSIIIAGDLLGRITDSALLDYIFKPLLMPMIMGYFYISIKGINNQIKNLLVVAFFFSWVGDISLMFQTNHELFFIGGLGSFLVTQVFYIITFFKSKNDSHIKKHPYLMIPFIAYGIFLYYILYPQLDIVLKIAVLLYAISLTLMVISSLNNYSKNSSNGLNSVFYGAFLFLISDSMIAINKFLVVIPFSGVWIMITYISAQYMIMKGYVLNFNKAG